MSAALGCLTLHAAGEAVRLYVAPNGDDAWSGRIDAPDPSGQDGPLNTLAGARNAVRRLRAEGAAIGPITVLLRGGVYPVAEPVVFTPEDSGSADAPVTYAAYPGERPVISGGRVIEGWRVEDGVWVVGLPEAANGGWVFESLWADGSRRHPARTPNEGFLFTAGRAPNLEDPETGEAIDRAKTAFVYAPGDIQAWSRLEDAIVNVYHSWDVSYGRIASLDEAARVVTFKTPASWPFENWGPGQRYFVENVAEALDAPGEWRLNRETGELRYMPMPGESPDTTTVVAPVASGIVALEGDLANGRFVEHLRFADLTLAHAGFLIPPEGMPDFQAAYAVPAVFMADGARNCAIEGCTITETDLYGVWLRLGCQDNRVFQNRLHRLGAGGVRIGEGRSPETEHEATERNEVDNNWIHDGGLRFPSAVGVWIGRSSYNRVTHNEISDLYYTGVSVGWSWGYAPSSAHHNVIAWNHIHDIGKRLLSDMGGIYLLGDAPGTVVRYNHIHDIYAYTYGGWGIYPDEGSTGLLIEKNLVYNTKTGGFHQHYGRDNIVRNNIFAFAEAGQLQRSREEDHLSFIFERNIVYYNKGVLLHGTWENDNWRMDHNCYWDADFGDVDFNGQALDAWRARGHDVNSIVADPLFVDPQGYDFRLHPESPAFALGFEAFDVGEVGLYGPASWVAGPRSVARD